MGIDWFTPEDSTAVERAGYDPVRRELRVVFAGDREYAYLKVPPTVFEELRRAPSVGQFVNWSVKPFYRYREVEPVRR
jgi:hypothetical protein